MVIKEVQKEKIRSNMGVVYNALNQYANAEKTLFAAIDVLDSSTPEID